MNKINQLTLFKRAFKLSLSNLYRNKFLSIAAIAVIGVILFVFNIILSNRKINKATANEETDYNVITKYILKNSKDIRPILIKLADVSHNSESLDVLDEGTRHTTIKKILNIYGPLAEYLNLNVLKKKIEEKLK